MVLIDVLITVCTGFSSAASPTASFERIDEGHGTITFLEKYKIKTRPIEITIIKTIRQKIHSYFQKEKCLKEICQRFVI